MKRFHVLLMGLLLANADGMPDARAAGLSPACGETAQLQQVAVRLKDQLGEPHRVCALGSLPDRTCEGSVEDVAVELLAPVAQGRAAVMASFSCADGTQRRMPLWFSVELPQRTPLARRALPAGAWVDPGDFEWAEQMRPAPADSWGAEEWVAGSLRLVRPLRVGDALHRRDLREAAAVEPGMPVEARLSQGGVRLQLDAVAMGGGAPGERIRVKSRLGGVSLPARVTGNQTVELLP